MNKPFDFIDWSFKLALAGGTVTGVLAIFVGLIGTFHTISAEEPEIVSTMDGSTRGFLVVIPVFNCTSRC